MVTYIEMAEMPGVPMFRCDRLRATLSVSSCAGMWRGGNQENIERLDRCKCCPIGAVHAGETAASMSPLMGASVCARCHVTAGRLIGKHLCVSCYNRQREWLIGKNSRGTAPIKMQPLYRRRIRYLAGGEPVTLSLDLSHDTTELVVAALRDSKKRIVFAFSGQSNGPLTQARLF